MTNLEQKKKLLEWVKNVTSGYKNVNVSNFNTSWQDGLAFCALAHHYRPDLIHFDGLDPNLKMENMDLAFKTLEKLGVDPLLEANDIVEYPDELSIRTYLMSAQPVLVSQHKSSPQPTLFNQPKPSAQPVTVNQPKPSAQPVIVNQPKSSAQPVTVNQHKETTETNTIPNKPRSSIPMLPDKVEPVPQKPRPVHKFSNSSLPLFQEAGNPAVVRRYSSRRDGLFSPASVVSEDVTPDLLYKVILIGDSSVGKTTLFGRWNDEKFMETSATVGVELGMKIYDCNGKIVKIQLWDTAGQEMYRSITRSYYRGAVGAFLVYDITKKQTFENVKIWLNDFKVVNSNTENLQILLVGNKSDLEDSRAISKEEGLEFAKNNGLNYFETSARNGSHCQKAFQALFQDIHKIFQNSLVSPYFPSVDTGPAPSSSHVVLFPDKTKKRETTCC